MPLPHGLAGVGKADRLAVDAYLTGVGVQETEEHVHQRGLPGAVLAEQSVDLALSDFEVDSVVRDQRAEAFCDVDELEVHRGLVGATARRTGANLSPVLRALRITVD